MLYIVAYDISDDRRRLRLSKALLDFGDRVQYSVFECLLDTNSMVKMTRRISDIIDMEEDSVRVYPLCAGCEKKATIIGTGTRTKDPEIYIL